MKIQKVKKNEEDNLLILDDKESKKECKVEREENFQPNHWENYLWRSKKLETVTFPEILINYQWCSRLDLIPTSWKKPDDNGNINYWEQQSVNVLTKRLRDYINNLSRSHTINDIQLLHCSFRNSPIHFGKEIEFSSRRNEFSMTSPQSLTSILWFSCGE